MLVLPVSSNAARLKLAGADEDGQGMVEYALLLVLVTIASIAALTLLGSTVADVFETVADAF